MTDLSKKLGLSEAGLASLINLTLASLNSPTGLGRQVRLAYVMGRAHERGVRGGVFLNLLNEEDPVSRISLLGHIVDYTGPMDDAIDQAIERFNQDPVVQKPCPWCDGSGRQADDLFSDQTPAWTDCDLCGGTGKDKNV